MIKLLISRDRISGITWLMFLIYLQVSSRTSWWPANEVFTRCSRRPTVSFTSRTRTSSRTFSRSWRIITRRERWVPFLSLPLFSPSEFDYLDVKMARLRFISLFAENSTYKVGSRSIYVRAASVRRSVPLGERERFWIEQSFPYYRKIWNYGTRYVELFIYLSFDVARGAPPVKIAIPR